MGKKSRESSTSKGERNNVSAWSVKAGRREMSGMQRVINQTKAFNSGKNVMLTIPNPNKGEKDKPFINKLSLQ